uniref:Uncharacterized protein n=1 Tax=Mesocestoides corti TaxID=53468 RepID=A0A5K3G3I8_MESCO
MRELFLALFFNQCFRSISLQLIDFISG